jgi:hypothetical protein
METAHILSREQVVKSIKELSQKEKIEFKYLINLTWQYANFDGALGKINQCLSTGKYQSLGFMVISCTTDTEKKTYPDKDFFVHGNASQFYISKQGLIELVKLLSKLKELY